MKSMVRAAPDDLAEGFAAIRRELDVPPDFPDAVLAAAEAARPADVLRRDATSIEFIAIDPPGATDLDQAFAASATESGYRVFYAIADVGAFVEPGGPIDLEARERGATRYSPDLRTPLHPPVLSEDRASLLPGVDRPALLWTIDLDETGEPTDSTFERATVQVRESITYVTAQERITAGDPLLVPLREIGKLRQQQEIDRGGISLNLPSQEVVKTEAGYDLAYDISLEVEDWNAQISLLTGIVAGAKMAEHKIGILRTLPATSQQDLAMLRRQAAALGIDWPADMGYPELIRSIDPVDGPRSAFLLQAARSFRGAGYVAVEGSLPEHHEHGAIASVYAHVTAPLRRLVDRFGNEILLALYAGEEPPAWAVEALDELPSMMGRARSQESNLEHAIVDFTEAMVLRHRIGESFAAQIVDRDEKRSRSRIQLRQPAVVDTIDSTGPDLGAEVTVKLTSVDAERRSVTFELA